MTPDRCYDPNVQPHSTSPSNEMSAVARARFHGDVSRKDGSLVTPLTIATCPDLGKWDEFLTEICYNKSSRKSETALVLEAPNAASVTDSRRRATMHNANSTISPDNRIDDDQPVDFDTPAGRSNADRLVLALRYPADADAVPVGSVFKRLAGRVTWLVVFDPDVLAGLRIMGWTDGGAS